MRFLYKQIFILIFLTNCCCLYANNKLERLKHSFNKATVDSLKLNIGGKIIDLELRKNHIDSAIIYFIALKNAIKNNSSWKDSSALYLICSRIYFKQDSFTQALSMTSLSEVIGNRYNDKRILINTYNNSFNINFSLGLYDECSNLLLKMISLKESSKDYKGLGYLYNGMGSIQQKRENIE